MPFFLTPGTSGSVHIVRSGFLLTQSSFANNATLPSWMSFNRATSTLTYQVPIDFDGSLNVFFDAFVDTTPATFQSLPFRVVNPAGFGGAYLLEGIIDTFRREHADTIVSGQLFVDPVTGNDNNSGTAAAPLRTIAAALASHTASQVVLAGGTYTEDIDFRDPSIAKILTSTGPVTFLVPGVDLGDMVWQDMGNGVWQTNVSGPPINTLLSNISNDSDGFDARLLNYSSVTSLQTASTGWTINGSQLTIKTAIGQTLSSFLTEYDALYSGDFLIYGANLALAGDFTLRGIGISTFANGDAQAEFWASGITSFRAPGLAFIGYGGDLIVENTRVHASLFDGLNANVSPLASSLIVDVNYRASSTGDYASFGETQFGAWQGSSGHANVNHLSIGSIIDHANGQGIADVLPGFSWVVDLSVFESRAETGLRTGLTGQYLDRIIYVDGIIGDASLLDGTLQASAGATIFASEVTGTIRSDSSSQIILAPSASGHSVVQETLADSGIAGALIRGTAANDVLIGSNTAIRLSGGQGDDTYYVYAQTNRVIEYNNSGFDRLYTAVDYRIEDFAEIELFSTDDHAGLAAIQLTGGFRNEIIYGNAGDNIIDGGAGIDSLYGQGGNDRYFVDNWGDYVRERVNEGIDRVYAATDYRLPAGQEIEILSTDFNAGIAPLTLIGNEFDNIIFGNAGNNYIVGGAGADSLYGGLGDDYYEVDCNNDYVREYTQQGFDRVYASVSYTLGAGQEIEQLSANNLLLQSQIDLGGNEFAQTIYGNAGSNRINGGGGADFLRGNGGADIFVFDYQPSINTAAAYIADFAADDRIALSRAIFTGLNASTNGLLDSSNFVYGTRALDANDHILFDARTGNIAYDPDGVGGQEAFIFATINTSDPFSAALIQVIA